MLGYLLYNNATEGKNKIIPPQTDLGSGWYDTGDIVKFDEDGFITILGRVKRFAKIAGEMISLGAVEEFISKNWPDKHHAVIAIPDERKGERLILLTEEKDLTRKMLLEKAKQQGISELSIPRTVQFIKKLPLLGSGKPDYVSLMKL